MEIVAGVMALVMGVVALVMGVVASLMKVAARGMALMIHLSGGCDQQRSIAAMIAWHRGVVSSALGGTRRMAAGPFDRDREQVLLVALSMDVVA